MAFRFRSHSEVLVPGVTEFNQRLRCRQVSFQLPERPFVGTGGVTKECFLYVEGGDVVRGGYVLKSQRFAFKGEVIRIGNLQLPLSEGVIDPAFGLVGLHLVRDAHRRSPRLFALGMGGLAQRLPQLLARLGWLTHSVPFWFRICHPGRVLREVPSLRRSVLGRAVASALAWSGAGALAVRAAQLVAARPVGAGTPAGGEAVEQFGSWADEVWEAGHRQYSLIGLRDRDAANELYARGNRPYLRLPVSREGRIVGWAVLLDTQMREHRQFGDLRVGTIVDCLAVAGAEGAVIQAASRFLAGRDVDLVVTNQSHADWCRALRRSGFVRGPSNYVFAASRELAGLLQPRAAAMRTMHLTRGDGEGPTNL